MVICTYFLNNSCRFGSKCTNDHIDLASVIKSEVDVTLKGNQWPLSCFGPFKEHNCIPNFIEDVSFEEVRMKYLEAKIQNNVPAHEIELTQMINDAKQKMQCLLNPSREIMNVLIEIYNQQDDLSAPTSQNSNVFGGNTNNVGSIFGGTTGSFTGQAFGGSGASTNIFGSTQNQSNIFGTSNTSGNLGGNIFAKPTPAPGNGNIFGQSTLTQPQSNSIFGGSAIFGGGGGNSMFNSVNQQQSTAGGSIFGGTSGVASTGNIFTQQAQSVFGQTSQNSNAFAGAAQPISNNAPFAAPATTPANIFGTSTFGTPTVTQQQSVPFSTFGQQSMSPFGQSMPAQSQQTSQNLFLPAPQVAQVAPTPVSQSPFGGFQSSSVFGTPAVSNSSTVVVSQSPTLYSRIENLTKEQLDAFKADRFELGKIPTVPPPRELCN